MAGQRRAGRPLLATGALPTLLAVLCLVPALGVAAPAPAKGKAVAPKPLDWWDKEQVEPGSVPAPAPAKVAAKPIVRPKRPRLGPPPRPLDDDSGLRLAVGLFGGVDFYSYNLDVGNNNRTLGLSPIAGPVWGARLGLDVDVFSLQVEGTLANSTFFEGAETAQFRSLRGTVLLHFPVGTLRPFLLGGAGVWSLANNPRPVRTDTDAAYHFGGGLRWNMSRRFGLRVEGRGIVSDGHDKDSVSLTWSALLGLTYRFFAG